MRSSTMLMRLGTMGSPRIRAAAKHNLREISGIHIDHTRSHLNVVLGGPETAHEVATLAHANMRAAGVPNRRNGTLAAEFIFGLPASTSVDTAAYFESCVKWVRVTYGEDVILSATVHCDEAAPHCHVLISPMKNGTWLRSEVFGRRKDVKDLHEDFFRNVAAPFGVRRAPPRMCIANKRAWEEAVLAHLKATLASVMRCETWPVVKDLIAADPRPWAEQLGLEMKVRLKTLAELKVSAGRGSRYG